MKFLSGALPQAVLISVVALPAAAQSVDQSREQMRTLSGTTVNGAFFPGSKRPANLEAFRDAALNIGNLARRNPNYRRDRGARAAIDLTGDTTKTLEGTEKIWKDNPVPPYFKDLVLHKELNDTCQYWAEYQASKDQMAHDAPGLTYQGHDMSSSSSRFQHFAGFKAMVLEGVGWDTRPDAFPETWMTSDTHYRPWFNIDHRTVGMGFGIAQSATGKWYGCKIALANDESHAAKLKIANAQGRNTTAQRQPVAPPPVATPGAPPAAAVATVEFDPNVWHTFTLAVPGQPKPMNLDIINGGPNNNAPALDNPGAYSGQFWKLRKDVDIFKLSTSFRGDDMCLDVVNAGDGNVSNLHLVPCGRYSGQHWVIEPHPSREPDTYRLTTKFRGAGKCLTATGFEVGNQAVLSDCGGNDRWIIRPRH